ncbi:MAG: hypothetical protein FJ206_14635 [Gemmatimonadetes bacterium]|nr:hypothetical protein [Gemmatimonadota bacterium]
MFRAFIGLAALVAGCGVSGRGTKCGIAALAGPTMLLEEFTKPGTTIAALPETLPPSLVVRMVAGDAQRAIVGRTDSSWIVGVDGPLPGLDQAGFGVLLVDRLLGPQGILIYDGPPIPGAPVIGTINLDATNLPLIGLTTQTAGFQDGRCPFFPDSLKT